MKQIKLLALAVCGFVLSANAQKTTDKAVINTPTVQCDMCKGKIERYLKRADGVTALNVDVKKKTTTVSWITDRTNIENIKAQIANVGYDADDVAAVPEAYAKLPKCCKKPEDQGAKPAAVDEKQ